eukprot:58600-Pelagomonas_calceolata.AAC.1
MQRDSPIKLTARCGIADRLNTQSLSRAKPRKLRLSAHGFRSHPSTDDGDANRTVTPLLARSQMANTPSTSPTMVDKKDKAAKRVAAQEGAAVGADAAPHATKDPAPHPSTDRME